MTSLRDFLRMALALALFLAGVAGARLQGEASALRVALGGGALCVADGGAPGETPAGPQHRHDNCVLCAQPLADPPVMLYVAEGRAWNAHVVATRNVASPEDLRPLQTPARGPPRMA